MHGARRSWRPASTWFASTIANVGLSSSWADAPTDDTGAAYRLSDMADDALAVLDAVGVERAHVMGLSMGGMIAQTLGDRTPGSDRHAHERDVDHWRAGLRTTDGGGPRPTDRSPRRRSPLRRRRPCGRTADLGEPGPRRRGACRRADAERAFARAFTPDGTARQFLAVRASGDRADGLRRLGVPTLVLHGDCDTLIDPSGGRRTAELVPGARFVLIEDMGHDYPPALWPRWVELVAADVLGGR